MLIKFTAAAATCTQSAKAVPTAFKAAPSSQHQDVIDLISDSEEDRDEQSAEAAAVAAAAATATAADNEVLEVPHCVHCSRLQQVNEHVIAELSHTQSQLDATKAQLKSATVRRAACNASGAASELHELPDAGLHAAPDELPDAGLDAAPDDLLADMPDANSTPSPTAAFLKPQVCVHMAARCTADAPSCVPCTCGYASWLPGSDFSFTQVQAQAPLLFCRTGAAIGRN